MISTSKRWFKHTSQKSISKHYIFRSHAFTKLDVFIVQMKKMAPHSHTKEEEILYIDKIISSNKETSPAKETKILHLERNTEVAVQKTSCWWTSWSWATLCSKGVWRSYMDSLGRGLSAGWGRWLFFSPKSSSEPPSRRKVWIYWSESSGGPQRQWNCWGISEIRRDWDLLMFILKKRSISSILPDEGTEGRNRLLEWCVLMQQEVIGTTENSWNFHV